jgi:DNA mismatch endonuclease, patch repair protein
MREIPYPTPTSAAATAVMTGNRKVDTRPEVALRSALHARGLRFRKNYPVATSSRRVRTDIAFPRQRVAIFVDGCFWHMCPRHGRVPRSNVEYWSAKLRRNVERDRVVDKLLLATGWKVLRIWEHEAAETAASAVAATVAESGRAQRLSD